MARLGDTAEPSTSFQTATGEPDRGKAELRVHTGPLELGDSIESPSPLTDSLAFSALPNEDDISSPALPPGATFRVRAHIGRLPSLSLVQPVVSEPGESRDRDRTGDDADDEASESSAAVASESKNKKKFRAHPHPHAHSGPEQECARLGPFGAHDAHLVQIYSDDFVAYTPPTRPRLKRLPRHSERTTPTTPTAPKNSFDDTCAAEYWSDVDIGAGVPSALPAGVSRLDCMPDANVLEF